MYMCTKIIIQFFGIFSRIIILVISSSKSCIYILILFYQDLDIVYSLKYCTSTFSNFSFKIPKKEYEKFKKIVLYICVYILMEKTN